MDKYKEIESLVAKIDQMDEELDNQNFATAEFIKQSFNTILDIHKEVVKKLEDENDFLKESLYAIQDINNESRETITVLTQQIKLLQDELEFTKRKYKLMWNKAVENYKK
jgi:exonuclease VII small subunit